MTLRLHRFSVFMLIAALSLPTSGCAYSGGPIKGKVLEEGTDKPLADAIVVVRWQGTAFSFIESPTVCIHVESATTDKDGRYRIPAWRASVEPSGVRGIEPIVTPYKAGYQWPLRPPESLGGGVQYLRPFTGTREEQLKYLRSLSGKECGSRDDYARKLIPLYRALYDEAKSIAVTQEEKHIAGGLHYSLDRLELGEDASLKRLSAGEYEK